MLSGRLVLITYTGKKSGMKHTLPVQYAKSDGELIVVAGYHQHKKWWRNLRRQSTVNICYHGKWFEASATAFEGDAAVIAPLLPAYLKRFPESARIRGLTLNSSGDVQDAEKLREAAEKVVVVNIRMPTLNAQASSKHLMWRFMTCILAI
jgi:deazaflavin-dependent oxidoreductase (nitroreductase family)